MAIRCPACPLPRRPVVLLFTEFCLPSVHHHALPCKPQAAILESHSAFFLARAASHSVSMPAPLTDSRPAQVGSSADSTACDMLRSRVGEPIVLSSQTRHARKSAVSCMTSAVLQMRMRSVAVFHGVIGNDGAGPLVTAPPRSLTRVFALASVSRWTDSPRNKVCRPRSSLRSVAVGMADSLQGLDSQRLE